MITLRDLQPKAYQWVEIVSSVVRVGCRRVTLMYVMTLRDLQPRAYQWVEIVSFVVRVGCDWPVGVARKVRYDDIGQYV
jgi:hypothetical protein